MNKLMSQRLGQIAGFCLLASLLLAIVVGIPVAAQDLAWEEPLNLSQSGTAVEPVLVQDRSGIFHVVWQDPFSGFLHAAGDGRLWSAPESFDPPFVAPPPPQQVEGESFAGYTPILLADNNDVIHAFWRNDEDVLLYSRAPISGTAGFSSWTPEQILAERAAAVDVLIDDNGNMHLSYARPLQSEEFPAGVYYRRSPDGGLTWSDARALYTSDYFRVLDPALANVQLAATGVRIVLVWDNPLLDTVFFMQSMSRGDTWSEPVPIDRRQSADEVGFTGPGQIVVAAKNREIHLVWRAEHEGSGCAFYHQWSADGAGSWAPLQVAFENSSGCPMGGKLFFDRNNVLFLLSETATGADLQAWDGTQWSAPERQEPLSSFAAPDTFQPVQATCRATAVTAENALLGIVCGQSQANDIWSAIRPLGELGDWSERFGEAPVWSAPDVLESSVTPPQSLDVVTAVDGRMHAFWSNSDQTAAVSAVGDAAGDNIYYARFEGGEWSVPRPVLASPAGDTSDPAVAANEEDLLFVVWAGADTGVIYFSRAVADRATSQSEWSTPATISLPEHEGAYKPDIAIDRNGVIYVSYAVPVNEERDVYLSLSTDNGDTWQPPARVFDGATAGWQVVGPPILTLTGNSHLHLLWTRNLSPNGADGLSFAYARSEDGSSWSEAEPLTADARIIWHRFLGAGDRILYHVWVGESDDRAELFHRFSTDDGISWSSPQRVSSALVEPAPIALVLDAAMEPHLFQIGHDETDQMSLREWTWENESWRPEERFDLQDGSINSRDAAAAFGAGNQLGILFAALMLDAEQGLLRYDLSYTSRAWEGTAVTPTPLPPLTPTPIPQSTPTPTPEPSPTPRVSFPTEEDEGGFSIGPLSADTQIGSIVLGVLPALIVIALVVAAGFWLIRTK